MPGVEVEEVAKLSPRSAIRKGVPQPIIDTQRLYYEALFADASGDEPGATDDLCKSIFLAHFASPVSHLGPHIDDMLWFVRFVRPKSRDAEVFLQRRGGSTEATLVQAEEEAFGSTPSLSASFSRLLPTGKDSPFDVTMSTPTSRRSGSLEGSRCSSAIRWRETLALNITTQWHYSLSVSVVRRLTVNGERLPVVVRNVRRRVYASPTKAQFQHKDLRDQDSIDYPNLYFNVDDFEDCFGGIQLCEGYAFAVQLTAGDTDRSEATVFRGVLDYDTIMKRVQRGVTERKTLPSADAKEFIAVWGPERRGKAEIAVCVNDAELQSFSNPAEAQASSSPKPRFFKAITNAFSPKQAPKLTGHETLQCFLTFISVNVNHVTSVLCSQAAAKGSSWLYHPKDRKELDDILVHPDNQTSDDESTRGDTSQLFSEGSSSYNALGDAEKTSPNSATAVPGATSSRRSAPEAAKTNGPKGLLQAMKSKFVRGNP